jgi:hypothetical protein
LTDLQQKVNNLQGNINNQRPMSGGQQVVGSNVDGTTLNEVRDLVRMIKSETNTLVQKSVREIFKLIRLILSFSSHRKSNVQL